ncbi:hypothetical protein Tco_0597607 [Tanacetum coccineum]
MSQDVLLTVMNSMSLIGESVNMESNQNESCDECFNLETELLKSQNAHNDLLKSYSQLEKHFISLELSIQLNQEIFQKDKSCNNQNALEILEFFENKDLKAQLQDKDTTISKLKEIIKSLREKSKEVNVNYDYCEIETKNVELENSSSKKAKIVESKNANHSEPNHTWGSNATNIPSSSSLIMTGCPDFRFGNDHIARIMGYADYQLGNVTISRVYYVKGLGHNLFSVGQFCDADLEVAFWKNTCFIHNLEGVDLLSGSQDINLYTISLDNMLKTSPICLLSKASKTKSCSGPGLHSMTPATSSSRLVPNPIPQQPCIPPPRDDWDRLFQPMFDEYFTPPSIVVSLFQEVAALRVVVLVDSSVSTFIDQDAPSSSTPSTQEQEQSLNIYQGFEESLKTPIFHDDPLYESLHEELTSQGSSSNVR